MINNFDPNGVALSSNNIFGLPSTLENSKLIFIPVPWEVTVSYRNGTARAPEEIFEASMQIDLYDASAHDYWKYGYHMLPIDAEWVKKNDYLRHCAELIISDLAEGGTTCDNKNLQKKLEEINKGGADLQDWLKEKALALMAQDKLVALIGGDHSTPLGLLKAIGTNYKKFGVLQIDAHMDLRKSYEGFTYSHASIMYNALEEINAIEKLVQVGVRDYCDEEVAYAKEHTSRIQTFFDQDIKERMYEGDSWKAVCNDIIEALPQLVYITFDIDGLDPKLCANTGTPVNGGFEVEHIMYLFRQLIDSGRKIIGFDLNEVACGELTQDALDANIGAHILYKMSNLFMKSQMPAV